MAGLFISHSSADDGFVRELRIALAEHGQAGWIDSRELRGGDPLWPEIQKAIESAAALQSEWAWPMPDGSTTRWPPKCCG